LSLDILPSPEIGHGLRRRPMFIEDESIDSALHRRAMFAFRHRHAPFLNCSALVTWPSYGGRILILPDAINIALLRESVGKSHGHVEKNK
jgi:hypothetical protein